MLSDEMMIQLKAVEPIHIHDTLYYNIGFVRLSAEGVALSDQAETMRINPEAFYPNPVVGDCVQVTMVMGTIMGAEKIVTA